VCPLIFTGQSINTIIGETKLVARTLQLLSNTYIKKSQEVGYSVVDKFEDVATSSKNYLAQKNWMIPIPGVHLCLEEATFWRTFSMVRIILNRLRQWVTILL